jgi:hypothetical protein
MTGNLDLGTNNIINNNLINGLSVTTMNNNITTNLNSINTINNSTIPGI